MKFLLDMECPRWSQPMLFISQLLSNLRNKHCWRVSKWQIFPISSEIIFSHYNEDSNYLPHQLLTEQKKPTTVAIFNLYFLLVLLLLLSDYGAKKLHHSRHKHYCSVTVFGNRKIFGTFQNRIERSKHRNLSPILL